MRTASRAIPPGSFVLDAGAGDAPYRELFNHCRYVTVDFSSTKYHDFSKGHIDIISDLKSIPLDTCSVDAILCTEVLEHVPDPQDVIEEFHRILKIDGELYLTVPFIWPLHEEPFDYYRYTSHSLRRMLENAGFTIQLLEPRGGALMVYAMFLDQLFTPHVHSTVSRIWRTVPVVRNLRGRSLVSRLILRAINGVTSILSCADTRWPNTLWAGGTITPGFAAHCVKKGAMKP